MDGIAVSILAGTVLGFLTGLGVGGGSLLILWLTQVQSVPQGQAQGINLLFFLPSAAISSLFRKKQGLVNRKVSRTAALFGCLTAALCAWLALQMDGDSLSRVFGWLLLGAGLWEISRKP